MIITPASLNALMTGFRREYEKGLGMADPSFKKIATVIPSSSKSNTYGWLGQFPQFREWIGSRVLKDMAAHGYQVTNKHWESSVGVSRDDIEDDEIGAYSALFQEMGRATQVHPDELVYALLAAGHVSPCYDGQNFFDDEHPVYPNVDGTGTAELISNQDIPATDPGDAWYLLDTTRAIKPVIFQERKKPKFTYMNKDDDEHVFMQNEYRFGVDSRSNVGFSFWQMAFKSRQPLTPENYAKARKALRAFTADGGRPLDMRPSTLLVGSNHEDAGLEIVKAERNANGATNVYRNQVELLVSPWLN